MGDRQTFQVMPSAAAGTSRRRPRRPRRCRSSTTTRSRAPHYYGVTFDNGLTTEIAPTDHAALFRFTFPGDAAQPDLRQRQQRRRRSPSTPATGTVTGYSDVRSGLSNGATRMFVLRHLRPARSPPAAMLPGGEPAPTSPATSQFDTAARPDRDHADRHLADQRRPGARRTWAWSSAPTTPSSACETGPSAVGRPARRASRSRAPPTTSCTTLYSNLYRLYLYPNSGHENTGTARRAGLQARRAVRHRHARRAPPDADRRADRRRQGLRQQRLLGHLPHHLAGLLAASPRRRPASWSTASSSSTATAAGSSRWSSPGLRQPDDRHQLGRRVRRRLRQGRRRASTRRPPTTPPSRTRPSRRRAQPEQPERRPQGPRSTSIFLGYTPERVSRGRLLGARGLHQRLRHRQHGREALPSAPATAAERAAATRRSATYFLQPRPELRQPVRPGDRLLPGPRRRRHVEVDARRTTTRGCGARARLHRDQRLELRVPRAAGRPGPRQPATAAATRSATKLDDVLRHAGDRASSRAPTAASSTR